jgi:hypothetical protein
MCLHYFRRKNGLKALAGTFGPADHGCAYLGGTHGDRRTAAGSGLAEATLMDFYSGRLDSQCCRVHDAQVLIYSCSLAISVITKVSISTELLIQKRLGARSRDGRLGSGTAR